MIVSISKDGAIRVIRAEVDRLLKGEEHLDNVVGSLIIFITRFEDRSLLDLAPPIAKSRLNEMLSEFRTTGRYEYFVRSGELVDDSETMRKLVRLLD